MAGYSGTSLVKKLDIKPGFDMLVLFAPSYYLDLLHPLPDDVVIKGSSRSSVDFVHIFIKEKQLLEKQFLKSKKILKKNGMLWVSWPKKSAHVSTDLNENVIRDFGLQHGLVDVKVCTIDDVCWG